MTKTTLFASIVLSLTLGACQKPADLDRMKHEWDVEAKVLADEAKQLARWQLLLEKKRTELTTRGPSRLVDQAQGPLTAAGDELREMLTALEKQIGPEAEAKRKTGKALELIKFTDTTAEHLTEELHNVRAALEAAESLLAAAEQAPVRVATNTPTPPTTLVPTLTPDTFPPDTATPTGSPSAGTTPPGAGTPSAPAH